MYPECGKQSLCQEETVGGEKFAKSQFTSRGVGQAKPKSGNIELSLSCFGSTFKSSSSLRIAVLYIYI